MRSEIGKAERPRKIVHILYEVGRKYLCSMDACCTRTLHGREKEAYSAPKKKRDRKTEDDESFAQNSDQDLAKTF